MKRGWAHVRRDSQLWAIIKPLARQMRQEPTEAERRLWEGLRRKQLGEHKFRRQHPIDRFVVDFYCAEAQLVIEVDGDIHQYTAEEDALRTAFLESLGLRVLRFHNDAVFADLDGVLAQITAAAETSPPSPLSARGEGESEVPSPWARGGGAG